MTSHPNAKGIDRLSSRSSNLSRQSPSLAGAQPPLLGNLSQHLTASQSKIDLNSTSSDNHDVKSTGPSAASSLAMPPPLERSPSANRIVSAMANSVRPRKLNKDEASFLDACKEGNLDIMVDLLAKTSFFKKAVDVNCYDKDGRTALMLAAANGRLSVVQQLCGMPNVDTEIKDLVSSIICQFQMLMVAFIARKHGLNPCNQTDSNQRCNLSNI
jgi:ankyrin repeat protein